MKFLVEEKEQIVFKGYQLQVFIPRDYFDHGIAEMMGKRINTIGIFLMKYFKDENDKKGKIYQMALPESIIMEYSEHVSEKISLNKNEEPEMYDVFTLINNDIFMNTTNLTQFFKNTERLVKLHHTARIPTIIDYSKIIHLYLDSMKNNKSSLNMPSLLLEMIISELARVKDDIGIPFRKEIGKSNTKYTENDYIQLSILNLAKQNSTFTAITSENMNSAIISSINKTHNQGTEIDTPIEKTIKY